MTERFRGLPFGPADILLPRAGVDLSRWAVVACDQYTSQPEYWAVADRLVGEAPSALRLILPESRLEGAGVDADIQSVHAAMEDYLGRGLLEEYPAALIYVERTLRSGKVRRGLVGGLDLAAYDFTPGSGAPVRATEGTVLSRIPPRAAVRRGAALELPHALVLADDSEKSLIEPLAGRKGEMRPLYDFDLMADSGHLSGWLLGEEEQAMAAGALRRLARPAAFAEKYRAPQRPPMLLAVGDGNHSLATAKAIWEERGDAVSRYALVELTNLHDDSLEFEPIHRLVFGVEPERLLAALAAEGAAGRLSGGRGEPHRLHYAYGKGCAVRGCIEVENPAAQLAVGTLQSFLDGYLAGHPEAGIDYIHGADVALALAGGREDAVAFLLPPMGKQQLFPTVIFDGVLPRKTFSMGQAHDKRFYLEGRRIR